MFARNKTALTHKVETLIGKGTVLNGKLESKGSVRIDGTFQGEINSQGDLVIGEDTMVKARINCANAIVAGRLEGSICARGKLDLRSTGVLMGDVEAECLCVEEGGVLQGNCIMAEPHNKRISPKKKAENTEVKAPEA